MAAPHELAFAAHRAGQFDEAEARYRQILAGAGPIPPDVRHAFAVLLMQRGRETEALDHLRLLAAAPSPPPGTRLLLAMACRATGRLAEGLAAIGQVLARHPRDAAAWAISGSLRVMTGDLDAGESELRRALGFDPRSRDARSYLAVALHRQQRWGEAIALQREVLAIAPDDATLRFNLALSLEASGDLPAARAELERVVQDRPARVDARARLANLQALTCDFEGEAASVAGLESLLAAPERLAADDQFEPFALTFLPLSRDAAKVALDRYVAKVRSDAAAIGASLRAPIAHHAASAWTGPLRIGYVSPDFGDHAVGGLVRDLFAAHDRSRVSVHGYSLRPQHGAVAEAIRAGCDTFDELHALPVGRAAERIAADGIQVLIDLGGYTLAARPELMALRPAPLQLGYLGFIHDYGAEWIDFLLLDRHLSPGAGDWSGAVPVIALPGSMLAAATRTPFSRGTRAEFGLPESGPLFASFNNSYKLDAALLDAWVSIAARLPEASFVVYVPQAASEGLRREWQRRGGRAEALVLVPKIDPARHLARAALCDLFLDAFRYQAGATAVGMLEAGLPVLCLAGTTPLSRLGVSINRTLGLDELVCRTAEEYVERAVALASAPEALRGLRRKQAQAIEQQRFFNPRRIAAAIEDVACGKWANRVAAAQRLAPR